jgi:hypothetical protein
LAANLDIDGGHVISNGSWTLESEDYFVSWMLSSTSRILRLYLGGQVAPATAARRHDRFAAAGSTGIRCHER